jgi:hypothetical protein
MRYGIVTGNGEWLPCSNLQCCLVENTGDSTMTELVSSSLALGASTYDDNSGMTPTKITCGSGEDGQSFIVKKRDPK